MPPPRLPPRRVLVVEDRPDCRDTLSLLLSVLGYEVRAAPDGPSGLSEAQAWQPDCVVCDVGLPGLDGWQLGPRLRACLGGDAVLVALTGYGTEEDRERSRLAGFNAHLVKPASPPDLVAALGPA
ncbi:MAG: response regulator [Gemmataceae bacterium]